MDPGTRIEGRNAVLEALRGGMELRRVVVARGAKATDALAEIERLVRERGVRIERVDRSALDRMSDHGSHQGVIAEMEPFAYTPLEEMLASVEGVDPALLIVLDRVTDPGNFGAIVRVGDVVGAAAVVVAARRAAPVSAVAFKSSAGALAHVPVVRETNLVRSIERIKEAGFWVAGAAEDASVDAWAADMGGRLALVMGAEGSGMARLTRDACDFLVRLPVTGHVGSLNVSQAAAVLCYEWRRRTASR